LQWATRVDFADFGHQDEKRGTNACCRYAVIGIGGYIGRKCGGTE